MTDRLEALVLPLAVGLRCQHLVEAVAQAPVLVIIQVLAVEVEELVAWVELFRLLLEQMEVIPLCRVLHKVILLVAVAVKVGTVHLAMKLVVTPNTVGEAAEAEAKKVTML